MWWGKDVSYGSHVHSTTITFNLSPDAPVLNCLSEPAKSTKLILLAYRASHKYIIEMKVMTMCVPYQKTLEYHSQAKRDKRE